MVRFMEMSVKGRVTCQTQKWCPHKYATSQKSVDQAERAISSFMESASKSVAMVPSPMNDAAQQALAITVINECQGHKEVMQLQTEFLRNQFGIATEQSKQMSGGIASPGEMLRKKSPTWFNNSRRRAAYGDGH
jgi:hypothetical protein